MCECVHFSCFIFMRKSCNQTCVKNHPTSSPSCISKLILISAGSTYVFSPGKKTHRSMQQPAKQSLGNTGGDETSFVAVLRSCVVGKLVPRNTKSVTLHGYGMWAGFHSTFWGPVLPFQPFTDTCCAVIQGCCRAEPAKLSTGVYEMQCFVDIYTSNLCMRCMPSRKLTCFHFIERSENYGKSFLI